MNNEAEFHQLMLERQQILEEALDRAESGVASSEDWSVIRSECGLPKVKLNLKEKKWA
jgi:hypothetical protein